MAYKPPAEMQKIIDVARDANRRLYDRSDQSLDELFADAREQGIFITSAGEDRETGMWRVYMRYRENDRAADSGYGSDFAEALFHGLRASRASGYAGRDLPSRKPAEPPLAHKSDARKTAYNSPALSEMPDEDPPWTGDAGAPVDDDEFDAIETPETPPTLTAEDVL